MKSLLSLLLALSLIWIAFKWFKHLFPSSPRPLNFVALDFETASSAKESICQIGMVVVKQSQIVYSQSWLVHPHTKYFSADMTSIHGISYAMVKNSPTFDKVWAEIEPHIKEYGIIAAHYAFFDISVLLATLQHYKITPPSFTILDSCIAARRAWPHLLNHKLPTIAEYLKVELQHHDALSDAQICAQILLSTNNKSQNTIIPMSIMQTCDKKEYNNVFFN
ncbi:3'-5' exonuclease [Pelosinus sp. Bkl1]|uniref:3'-5' exonuclease n=1 Tax=Pelosinus baikalensis TaxID=2892015 RepID=A0ABS8HYU5_9FIRM|nr:3'-5' exonuclease [Pelosinus baikalensis]